MYLLERVITPDCKKYVLLVCLLALHICLPAQKKISVDLKNVTIEQAFKTISKESGYTFAYNKSKYTSSKTVSLSLKDTPLDEVLKQVLKGTGYSYSISNDRIFLTMAKEEKKPEIISKPVAEPIVNEKLPEVTEVKTDTTTHIKINPKSSQLDSTEVRRSMPPMAIPKPTLSSLLTFSPAGTPSFKNPHVGLKTNLLYDLTSTFNLGAEVRLSDRYTFDLSVNYNPWTFNDNKKISHLMFQPELRYWLCESFKGHFFGLHAQYARFNVGGVGFNDYLKDHRFQGDMFGAGFSYGYQWYLSPRWSMEATVGFGYNYLDYKRYECKNCGNYIDSKSKNYFGPTKAGVSLIYMIK